ncbi:plexin-B2a [Sardina pilchardus]|uniref:plexin-B2a n=1 Tax=Sardina pilchardus TaxID=27697 RepID=UPI002E10F399
MALWALAGVLVCLSTRPSPCSSTTSHTARSFASKNPINNVVQDPANGRVYAGAVNFLYQLDANLSLEHKQETGPHKDSPHCTPPIINSNSACVDPKDTDNHNKLLLVNSANGSLVVCGSLFRGICSLVNLTDIKQVLYYSDSKGEKTYVASTEESVNVVGVMSSTVSDNHNLSAFVVAKGYGPSDGSKLISTRVLEDFNEWVMFENIVDASTVQASSFAQRYLHDFRHAFKDSGFVYFLFSRTTGVGDKANFTFVARLCENDTHYYSYTELQLNCSGSNRYNKVQAAYVAPAGVELARDLTAAGEHGPVEPDDLVVYAVFSSDEDATGHSALCTYPLPSINRALKTIISACYNNGGLINGKVSVYSPYVNKEACRSNEFAQNNLVDNYICGDEFLPSPLAGKPEVALSTTETYTRPGLLTAVAVAVETYHTVVFLGTIGGEVHKVHLANNSHFYGKVPGVNTGERINKNMFFDLKQDHLYITSEKTITMAPVQACHLKKDCQSCMALRDPYCGWCVLEGRCTRKGECESATEENAWLWSPQQECVTIEKFTPPNISCKKTQNVVITIPKLPPIDEIDRPICMFGLLDKTADVSETNVTCHLPEVNRIPPTPGNQDYVAVPVRILLTSRWGGHTVEVAVSEFQFYNCAAVVKSSENTPCSACVNSQWGCQWNTKDHTCSDSDDFVNDHIVKHKQGELCPQFENPQPLLIPVGIKTPITFQGKNLEVYQGESFKIGTDLMKQEEEVVTQDAESSFFNFSGYVFSYDKTQEVNVTFHIKKRATEKKIDSTLQVVLYNCSVGREDCSLCKNANETYGCVWCATTHSCIYKDLCPREELQCPEPTITDIMPRFGPLNGNIEVTIKGSNLGIKQDDIKRITVAGEPCEHKADKYSVSTSVVCKIGPVRRPPESEVLDTSVKQGVVEVEVEGGRKGTSEVLFTYRDPQPERVFPNKGPAAGGTNITIRGKDLDTASQHDISILVGGGLGGVGGVPCTVLSFGEVIICKTGDYTGPRLPTEHLPVTVKYGSHTTKEVRDSFQYADNPKVTTTDPKNSFVCGGRNIMVQGTGFSLTQLAQVQVRSSGDGTSSKSDSIVFLEDVHIKNDSFLEFLSPKVSKSDDLQALRTVIQLDNQEVELTGFHYHPDPVFENLTKTFISENSVIIVSGRGFAKAMTAREAEAYLGDVRCNITILNDDKIFLEAPATHPTRPRRHKRDTNSQLLDLVIKFGNGEWKVGSVQYERKYEAPLLAIIPGVIIPMVLFIIFSVYCYRRKSQQAEREYEKVKHQLENLEESVRDRCKKEFTDLMIEMEDHTNDLSEARIPFLDYKNYTDRVFFLPSKDGANDVMITGKLDIPEARRAIVAQALNQFSNLLNSKTFLINFIRTLESRPDFNARARVYFASLLTVALHGKLEYYTDIMRTLLLEMMEEHVQSKNPKLMLRRSETVVERMLCNWMSICLYQFLKDTVGEPLYKLFKAIKHQVEKGPVDAKMKKAKYTLNDTGLLGDDVEYCVLTLQVLVHGEGPDVTPVKVLNCDTISQVKEKIIEQVYRNLPYSQRPKVESVALEWRPGSTGQILSDLDLTSQKEGRWKRLNTLAHYNVRDNATLVLSRVLHTQQSFDQNQDNHEERNALLEDDKVFHLVRPVDELEEGKSKRGSIKDKATTKAITEIYLTRLLSVKGTLQQFVDDFFRSVLCSGTVVPPAVKYFFDFLDEQAQKHDNVDEETIHIWKTNSLPLRYWVNILKNPHFIFDVHMSEVVDASLSVIAQTFMDACTKTEHKLSRESPSNKLLYAKEISTYKKMVDDYYKGIRQMVQVSDQDMNTHLAEISRSHTDKLNTQVALHQLYQYASKYYDGIIASLDEDPAAQSKQLTLRLQQIAAALENKVTDL